MDGIGNITFINQNAQVGATQQAAHTPRVDAALQANIAQFVSALRVEETAPIEEQAAIDPEREQKNPQGNESKDSNTDDESASASQDSTHDKSNSNPSTQEQNENPQATYPSSLWNYKLDIKA